MDLVNFWSTITEKVARFQRRPHAETTHQSPPASASAPRMAPRSLRQRNGDPAPRRGDAISDNVRIEVAAGPDLLVHDVEPVDDEARRRVSLWLIRTP